MTPPQQPPAPTNGIPTRVWVAVGLLGLLIALVTVSALTPYARVCEGQEGNQTCRPLSYGDPTVLLGAGLVVLVAFPDIKWFKAGSGGVEAGRDPEMLSGTADLRNRMTQIENKVQRWDQAGAEDSGAEGGRR